MSRFDAVVSTLDAGIHDRRYPGAVVEVGSAAGPSWRHAVGRLTYDPASATVDDDTVFDLASLTKVIATTSAVMRLIERGTLSLADRVARRSIRRITALVVAMTLVSERSEEHTSELQSHVNLVC